MRDGNQPNSTERALRVLMLVALTALVAVTFGRALLGRGVFVDVGTIRNYWPFAADGTTPAGAMWCRGDTWDYYLPGISTIVEGARHGDWVTWAPYEVGGAPLASLPNHAALSPLSWPYWVMPLWLAPAFVKLTEIVVAVAGTVAFLGRLGVRRGPGLVAGFVFVTSGFMVMWTGWPHTRVAALIPLLFWALDRVVVERRPRDVAYVGLVVAGMLLGGFPAVTLYALTTAAVYVVVTGLRQGAVRATVLGWLGAGVGVVLGAGLAAVQILPFVRDLGTVLEGRAAQGASPTELLVTAAAPTTWGTCVDGQKWGPTNPIEGITFVGAAAVVLVLMLPLLSRNTRVRAGAVTLVFAMAAAWCGLIWFGGPPLEWLQKLPGFSTNKIGRGASVFGFLVALAVGLAVDRLLNSDRDTPEPRTRRRRAQLGPIALLVAGIGVGAYVLVRVAESARGSGDTSRVVPALVVPAVLTVVALLAVAVAHAGRGRWRPAATWVVVAVLIGQALAFTHEVWPVSSRRDLYPQTPAHDFLSAHLGHDRYAGGASWGYPATSDHYRLRTPVGHEFTALPWKELLDAISPQTRVTRTFSAFPDLPTAEIGDSPVLDQMSVRYWATRPSQVVGERRGPRGVADRTVTVRDGGSAACEVSAGSLRGVEFAVADTLRQPQHGRTRIEVRVEQDGRVVTGVRAFDAPVRAGQRVRVAVFDDRPADTPSDGQAKVTLRFIDTAGPVALKADAEGLLCRAIAPADDGLRLVHADAGSVIYERLTSLPRIRWAGTSEVVADPQERVRELTRGVPDGTVLLDESGLPAAEGSQAEVDVVSDAAESIAVDVDASGEGYLLVADSIARSGWRAEVDGEPTAIVPANHAFAAVPVGAGRHRVEFTYDAPGLRAGAVVSAGSVLVTVVLIVLGGRRRRRPKVDPGADGATA